MRSMKTAGDGDLITFGNFAFAKLLGARSSFQHKKLLKPRHTQGQEFLVANQFAAYCEADFPGSESGVLDRLGNSCGIETSSRLGCEDGCTFLQTDVYFTDAIQASQGFFRPVSSKRSRHPIDADLCFRHLGLQGRWRKRCAEKQYETSCGERSDVSWSHHLITSPQFSGSIIRSL